MQAGVVRHRSCRLDYACAACRFDWALDRQARRNLRERSSGRSPAGRRGAIVSWKERLRRLPPPRRPCLHHLKQRIGFKPCLQDYACATCEFDQFFCDHERVFARVRPVELFDIQGVRFPQGYYLHPGHGWASLAAGGAVRIGLDDFAHKVFGPPERIEAARIGQRVRPGGAAFTLCRGGRRAPVRAPVGGVVTAANAALAEGAQAASRDPYGAGWVLQVAADDLRRDLTGLKIGAAAARFLAAEVGRLERLIEARCGPLSADGGFLGPDLFGHLPQLGWARLARHFLRR
jgi:glycine cleavage system H lipoate-binding protein